MPRKTKRTSKRVAAAKRRPARAAARHNARTKTTNPYPYPQYEGPDSASIDGIVVPYQGSWHIYWKRSGELESIHMSDGLPWSAALAAARAKYNGESGSRPGKYIEYRRLLGWKGDPGSLDDQHRRALAWEVARTGRMNPAPRRVIGPDEIAAYRAACDESERLGAVRQHRIGELPLDARLEWPLHSASHSFIDPTTGRQTTPSEWVEACRARGVVPVVPNPSGDFEAYMGEVPYSSYLWMAGNYPLESVPDAHVKFHPAGGGIHGRTEDQVRADVRSASGTGTEHGYARIDSPHGHGWVVAPLEAFEQATRYANPYAYPYVVQRYSDGSNMWSRLHEFKKLSQAKLSAKADSRITWGDEPHPTKTRVMHWETGQVYATYYGGKERKSNPADGAAGADEMYSTFHGSDPTETVVVEEVIVHHGNVAALGDLEELVVVTPRGHKVVLDFTADPPLLCSSSDGRQLLLRGGDMSIDLAAIKMNGDEWVKDVMVLGDVLSVTYRTAKTMDQGKVLSYEHKFATEDGTKGGDLVYPVLIYDSLNNLLSFAGGTSINLEAGIVG